MHGLTLRLNTIYSLIPQNAKVCDIGCDHAFLPIALIKSGKAKSVIACDVNEKPLKKAAENIKKSGVTGISLRLSNGLSNVKKGEADTFLAAGIGGEVISDIILRGAEILKDTHIALILQPTTSPERLRRFIYENGFLIESEAAIAENGKLYSVMLCKYNGQPQKMPEWFYFSGKVNPKDPVGKKYIEKQAARIFKCMTALQQIKAEAQNYAFYKEIYEGLCRLTANF